MHFRLLKLAAVVSAFFTVRTLAGHNCKCQDADGAYYDATDTCCWAQQLSINKGFNDLNFPGPSNQCVSDGGEINSGQFVICCQEQNIDGHQVGGAFCWAK